MWSRVIQPISHILEQEQQIMAVIPGFKDFMNKQNVKKINKQNLKSISD